MHLDFGLEIRIVLDELTQAEARQALHQQSDGVIGDAEQLVNGRNRANRIQVRRAGFFNIRVTRRHQADQFSRRDRYLVHQLDRTHLANGQRDGRLRIDHHAAQGQDGQYLRVLDGFLLGRNAARRIFLLFVFFLEARKNGRQQQILDGLIWILRASRKLPGDRCTNGRRT